MEFRRGGILTVGTSDQGSSQEKAQSKEGATPRKYKAPIQHTQEVNWWEEEVEQGVPTGSFLPEHHIAKLSQIMTIIIGEPVSTNQVSLALQLVTPQEDDQENSDSMASNSEAKEEEEEGAVGSVETEKKGQISQEVWEPLEQNRSEINPAPQRRTPNKGNKVRLT